MIFLLLLFSHYDGSLLRQQPGAHVALSSQAQAKTSLIAALQKLQCTDLDSLTEVAMLSSHKQLALGSYAYCLMAAVVDIDMQS